MSNRPSRPTRLLPHFRVLIFFALVVGACASKDSGKNPVLGELAEVLAGQASHRGTDMAWNSAKAGDLFYDGEAIRTGDQGVVRLKFANEILRMGRTTTVFFGKKKLDFEGEIEVGEGIIEMAIDFGDAEVVTTGRVRLVKRGGDNIHLEVLEGSMTITEGDMVSEAMVGEELDIHMGPSATTIKKASKEVPADASVDELVPALATEGVTATVLGAGVRIRPDKSKPWRKLDKGVHDLGLIAQIDLRGSKAKVVLQRGSDSVTLSGTGSAVANVHSEEFVRVTRGRLAGESSDRDVLIAVPGGTVRLLPGKHGTKASIKVSSSGALTRVSTGEATLSHGSQTESLYGGESARLTTDGITSSDKAPTDAYMTLQTPRAATIHVLHPPTNVRIDFHDHCERGVVEIDEGGNFKKVRMREGNGAAIIRLASGMSRYRVRCYEGDVLAKNPVTRGRLTIRRDAGSKPLAKGAPRNTMNADGRSYNILYQNNLPALTLRWKNAPSGSSYVLRVEPITLGGKKRKVEIRSPQASFSSGAYVEGRYQFWFAGAGKESKRTTFRITFDNAASKGYLSSPKPGQKLEGATARVSGAAVKGWAVSVEGKNLKLDRQFRFDQEVPIGHDGIAVRFSHPKYGVHYYLRRK